MGSFSDLLNVSLGSLTVGRVLSALVTQILLSPIFRASDFTVNVKNSLPRFNLHQKISLLWKCVIRSEEIDSHWRTL